jgi:hypothetical protein
MTWEDLRADLAEYLNGEWPHCFNDGFQDAVAAALTEHLAAVAVELREEAGSPPAPGHRRLRAILADVSRVDPGQLGSDALTALTALRREGTAAWYALFDIQVQAALARRRRP